MLAVHQQHVVVGQPRQPLLHQRAHVINAAHLLGQQDQRGRGGFALKGLHLDRHLVVGQGALEQLPQFFGIVLAIGVGQFTLLLLQGVV